VALALFGPALSPAFAQRIPPDFRSAFEGQVYRGAYAVMVQPGVPTTSIYGVRGDSQNAYYSVDVKGGQWQTSQGFLDFDQVAADTLNLGEVLEVTDVTFKDKDNRVDLRMVSVEAHKVTRGEGFARSTKREPTSTNFKFFFPFPLSSARDVPEALNYVGSYLRVFRTEDQARAFAGELVSGGARSASARRGPDERRGSPDVEPARASGPSRRGGGSQKEVKPGMTALEVVDILGKPDKEVTFQSQSKWTYPDLTVIFENGRVKDVKF
jgi:hypothetical protein